MSDKKEIYEVCVDANKTFAIAIAGQSRFEDLKEAATVAFNQALATQVPHSIWRKSDGKRVATVTPSKGGQEDVE